MRRAVETARPQTDRNRSSKSVAEAGVARTAPIALLNAPRVRREDNVGEIFSQCLAVRQMSYGT
jgi:hypothetical protein